MKTIIVAIGIMLAFSACNKCVTCSNGVEYCKDNPAYKAAKDGLLTNAAGTESLTCH